MSNADRNAALYRQRMTQTNQQLGMSGPPPRQHQQFDPRVGTPPHMPPSVARPPPPGAPRSVKKLTGSSRKIPPNMDPSDSYHNIKNKEKMSGDSGSGEGSGMLSGINQLVVGIIIVVALASIFVLPKQLKVFWVIILALTFLIHLGFMLYKEWMKMGTKDDGGDAKYAEWASVLLYALVMLYSAVMTGILFFFAWSLYSISHSRTNIARLDNAAIKDYDASMSSSKQKRNKVYV